jgi:hypothetical protein
MADIEKLKGLLDAYGVGVRAGVLTPCLDDENAFRAMLGLDAAPSVVVEAWDEQGGIRIPVTLQKPGMIEEEMSVSGSQPGIDAAPEEDATDGGSTPPDSTTD